MSTSLKDAWIYAVTSKKPRDLVSKMPMFGHISVETKNKLALAGAMPVGLTYPMIDSPQRVHEVVADPYNYLVHDLRFHYENLFFLRAYGENVYQCLIHFTDVLAQQTGLTAGQYTRLAIDILDIANSYYSRTFTQGASSSEQLRETFRLSQIRKNEWPAMLEYIFLLVCDIVKKPDMYKQFFPDLNTGAIVDAVSYHHHKKKPAYYLFSKKLTSNFRDNQYKENVVDKINRYSHSLGAFLCMCLYKADQHIAEIFKLCDILHELEQRGELKIKWNKQDGMMLDIDEYSFRFRKTAKPDMLLGAKNNTNPVEKDARFERKYNNDGRLRKFSHERNWFTELRKKAEEKLDKISSIDQQQPVIDNK